MTVVEFGTQNKDTVILLHGGGLSWWNYREVAKLLETDYHVILPVLDGHAGSGVSFTTIEDNAARLISYMRTDWFGMRRRGMTRLQKAQTNTIGMPCLKVFFMTLPRG